MSNVFLSAYIKVENLENNMLYHSCLHSRLHGRLMYFLETPDLLKKCQTLFYIPRWGKIKCVAIHGGRNDYD